MSNYWEKMSLDSSDVTDNETKRRREAYEKAHDIRKFEIGLFWQRATYYWAFILAAFTAHFALIGLLFDPERGKELSITELLNLPGLSLFALIITSFFCFFFCICWVMMNKGSKYWQKNWECHIDELEQEFSGDLYKVILNTENKCEFEKNPLKNGAYDYSVSKITSLTSIVLMVFAFFMSLFYIAIFVVKFLQMDKKNGISFILGIAVSVIFGFIVGFSIFCLCHLKGNAKKSKNSAKWINREELQ